MKRDVLHDAIALVEDAEDGDALPHRSHPALAGSGLGDLGRGRRGRIPLFLAAAAGDEGQRDQRQENELSHAYSGIHGS